MCKYLNIVMGIREKQQCAVKRLRSSVGMAAAAAGAILGIGRDSFYHWFHEKSLSSSFAG